MEGGTWTAPPAPEGTQAGSADQSVSSFSVPEKRLPYLFTHRSHGLRCGSAAHTHFPQMSHRDSSIISF